jgi:hypothetical protein
MSTDEMDCFAESLLREAPAAETLGASPVPVHRCEAHGLPSRSALRIWSGLFPSPGRRGQPSAELGGFATIPAAEQIAIEIERNDRENFLISEAVFSPASARTCSRAAARDVLAHLPNARQPSTMEADPVVFPGSPPFAQDSTC